MNTSKSAGLWSSALGKKTCSLQMPEIAPLTRLMHGDVVLWIGDCPDAGVALQGCMIRHTIFASQAQTTGPSRPQSMLRIDLQNLPFPTGSLDGLVLHHSLELVSDPRAAMKEVERVLVPGGKLLICGFNPFSLYGLRRLYAAVFGDPMSTHNLINPMRLFDWLALLDLQLDRPPKYFEYSLPVSQSPLTWLQNQLRGRKWLDPKLASMPWLVNAAGRLREFVASTKLPFGGLLIISATKQTASTNMQIIDKKVGMSKKRALRPAVLHKIGVNKE